MKTIYKIFLSFLLVYEPVSYWILADSGYESVCRDVLPRTVCSADSRFFWFMIFPIIFMLIYLMWEKQISSLFAKNKTKKIIPISRQKKQKQRIIGPIEALGRFVVKAFCAKDTAQRSEYWWILLPIVISSTLFSLYIPKTTNLAVVSIVIEILLFVPFVNLNARRWNDLGFDGALIAWSVALLGLVGRFVPDLLYVLWIFGLCQMIAFCFPGQLKDNKYRNPQQDQNEKLYI